MIAIDRKQKILIVDDSEMNRAILADILDSDYEILEAENGVQGVAAISKYGNEILLVLLDIVMPQMNGFEMLGIMNQHRWIEDIPVIMISAETDSAYVERAYNLGVSDFITRPFDALVVRKRVGNMLLLYAKQKKLVDMVSEQILEKEQNSNMMVEILSHIVEFRNGESGRHVTNVRMLTELLLKNLMQVSDRWHFSPREIALIGTASALHDIGKIAIPEEILNKPGKFTDEEFAIMKTHSMVGAQMLEQLPMYQQEPLVKRAYEICRWHHERYDGRGYPDGLVGDEIPISAQIVALADVYDALTSERVYKKAIPHAEAIEMILAGQCGAFNPELMECLRNVADAIKEQVAEQGKILQERKEFFNLSAELSQYKELTASSRTFRLLEHERERYRFFASLSQEIQFEYTSEPPMVTLTPWSANELGIDEIIMDPLQNQQIMDIMDWEDVQEFVNMLHSTTPEEPAVTYDCRLHYNGKVRWHRIYARAMWYTDDLPLYTGSIGKAIDIHASRLHLDTLERMASHDSMTGLLNHASAKKQIMVRMDRDDPRHYALVIFDLDHFKSANDTYGHMFGDEVLKFVSERLRQSVRDEDIAARVGGDEFLIFLEYETELEPIVERIFHSLEGQYEDFAISISMGVAEGDTVGNSYDQLFHAADQALYNVKRNGRGHYLFYDDSMSQMLSSVSPIDGEEDGRN